MISIKPYILLLLLGIGINNLIYSQDEVIPLWPSKIPGYIENEYFIENEINDNDKIYGFKTPTLSIFFPKKKKNGTSVIICPGGGYAFLSIDLEGYSIAKWLNSLGITAIVLKYRLPNDLIMEDKSIAPLQDAQEAMRVVRRNAIKWKINPKKIGIMGFSAGGHLASTLSTQYNENTYTVIDSTSAKPDFSILIYPVISMKDPIAHKGSRGRLLGWNSSDFLINKFSNEDKIDANTPPTFLIHTSDDSEVSVINSITYYNNLKKHNVPSEMHIYENGNHGFGIGKEGTSKFWTKDCENWLRFKQYIK